MSTNFGRATSEFLDLNTTYPERTLVSEIYRCFFASNPTSREQERMTVSEYATTEWDIQDSQQLHTIFWNYNLRMDNVTNQELVCII